MQRFCLEVADRPDVLPRVVGMCRRRGAEIVSMQFVSGDRHRPGRLDLALRAPRPMDAWLAGLVDVQEVRRA